MDREAIRHARTLKRTLEAAIDSGDITSKEHLFSRAAGHGLKFQPGLNALVGPNNVGKSAVIDALRTLLAGLESRTHVSISPIVTGP